VLAFTISGSLIARERAGGQPQVSCFRVLPCIPCLQCFVVICVLAGQAD
jgi:hypothetical protein